MILSPKKTRLIKIILLSSILIFVIFTRFAWLSEKPYHHDEAQYATFSWYNYNGSLYKYDPVLHGPFLTYFNILIYSTLGVNDFTARSGPALLGVMLTIILLLMYRFIGFFPAIILATAYAVSPSFTYFARFLGTDTYIAFFSVIFIYFFCQHIRTYKPLFIYLSSAALAFLFLVKVNSYIYAFIFLSFLIILLFISFPEYLKERKKEYKKILISHFLHIILGICLFFFIFALFYTSLFYHIQGFFDGLFIKSLGYWAGQHAEHRIKGDFDYYIPIMLTYELPVILIAASAMIFQLVKTKRSLIQALIAVTSSLIIFVLIRYFWSEKLFTIESSKNVTYTLKLLSDKYLHMEYPYHILMTIIFVYAGGYSVYKHIKEGKIFKSFIAYWFIFSLLIYSYAGEKVPWLSLNILMPMFFYSAISLYDFHKYLTEKKIAYVRYTIYALILISLTFTIYIQNRVTIKYPADPKERLVYVQTSEEISLTVKKIKNIADKTFKGKKLPIAIHGQSGWPLNWYFRGYKTLYPPPPIKDPESSIIIMDHKNVARFPELKETYNYEKVKLREWWVPDMRKKVTSKNIIDYYLKREVWSITGSWDIGVFIRKDLE